MKTNQINSILAICLIAATTVLLASCAKDGDAAPEPFFEEEAIFSPYVIDENGEVSLRTNCDGNDIHWEYEGVDGPSHWGDLCSFWDCDGKKQSPVNIIPPPVRQKSKSLYFYWKDTETNIVNNGHTIQYNYDQASDPNEGSYLTLNGQKYHLLQFHFHAASEHTVKGEHYPAEIHFVHQNMQTGKLAVIGVFVKEGAANPFFADIHDEWPHSEGDFESSETFNASALMPTDYNHWLRQHFWYYDGSLTTPPCSEIVSWFVMTDPIEASHEQIEDMESILHENYRPVQPLNARLVKAQ
jgi:carbonic anhydrase